MAILKSAPIRQAFRYYTSSAAARNDRLGSAAAVGYWITVMSAPFAGAFLISQAAAKDKRFANMRSLSFRDCLPGSSLDDYAGAFMHLRR